MIPLETQIAELRELGLRLKPAITLGDLFNNAFRDEYEEDPYALLISVMGHSVQFSDDIVLMDMECIDDPLAYTYIAERLVALTGGDLPIDNIRSRVDFNTETAWLAFSLNGQDHRWELEYESDWMDGSVFGRFAELLAAQPTTKRYTSVETFGQDVMIGCATPEQLAALIQKTGVEFKWLA